MGVWLRLDEATPAMFYLNDCDDACCKDRLSFEPSVLIKR